jgi:hypothetical protein
MALLAAGAGVAMAQNDEAKLTCTNPASGAQWQIRIDYKRATVDSFAADISNDEISWHDPKDGGNYTLDRNSGELSAVFASSTGGYFLHDRCSPKTAH